MYEQVATLSIRYRCSLICTLIRNKMFSLQLLLHVPFCCLNKVMAYKLGGDSIFSLFSWAVASSAGEMLPISLLTENVVMMVSARQLASGFFHSLFNLKKTILGKIGWQNNKMGTITLGGVVACIGVQRASGCSAAQSVGERLLLCRMLKLFNLFKRRIRCNE